MADKVLMDIRLLRSRWEHMKGPFWCRRGKTLMHRTFNRTSGMEESQHFLGVARG